MTTQNLMEIHQANSALEGYMTFIKYASKVTKYADARLREDTGLSFIRYMALYAIAANGETMTPSEIANRTSRNRNDITILVQRLVQDGLVVAERSDIDKRYVNVTLTDKGKGVLLQTTVVANKIAGQVMLSMTKADVVKLEKLMGLLGQNADDGLYI